MMMMINLLSFRFSHENKTENFLFSQVQVIFGSAVAPFQYKKLLKLLFRNHYKKRKKKVVN